MVANLTIFFLVNLDLFRVRLASTVGCSTIFSSSGGMLEMTVSSVSGVIIVRSKVALAAGSSIQER